MIGVACEICVSQWAYLPVRKYSYLVAVPRNSREWPTWQPSIGTENIPLGPVLAGRDPVPTRGFTPVSPFWRFVATDTSQMLSVPTEWCHVGQLENS